MALGIVITLILFSIVLIWPKSKMGFALTLLFIWVLYCFATTNGDYTGYENPYNDLISKSYHMPFEPEFTFLMLICKLFNLPFIGFRIFCGTIFTVLLAFVINKYTKCVAMASFLFLVFPFAYFSSVMRSGISLLIIALVIDNLYLKKKLGWLKFLIGLIFAISFHYSSIFFALFFFAMNTKCKMKTFLIIAFSMLLLTILFYNSGLAYEIVANILGEGSKIAKYLNPNAPANRSNLTGIITSIGVVMVNVFLSYALSRIADDYTTDEEDSEENQIAKLANFVKLSSTFLILTIPFLLMASTFLRYSYAFTLLNILSGVNVAYLISKKPWSRHKFLNSFPAIISPILLFTVLIFVYSELPYVNEPFSGFRMFENNYILNFLGF